MSPSPRSAPAAASARTARPSAAEHVVFGAGAVGLAIADALLARGVAPGQVRVVNRSIEAARPYPAVVATFRILGVPLASTSATRRRMTPSPGRSTNS